MFKTKGVAARNQKLEALTQPTSTAEEGGFCIPCKVQKFRNLNRVSPYSSLPLTMQRLYRALQRTTLLEKKNIWFQLPLAYPKLREMLL